MDHDQRERDRRPQYGTYSGEYLTEAHRATFANEAEILASTECRCFFCGFLFNANDEEHLLWAEERPPLSRTLHCPNCLVDCVIGSSSGYPINDEAFIYAASEAWFNGYSNIREGELGKGQRPILIIVD